MTTPGGTAAGTAALAPDEEVAAAFRTNAAMYRAMGSELYGCLFERAADDPALVELARHGQAGARPVHLLSAVHDLLLRERGDPLARFFATLADRPHPPGQAFAELQRFCRDRRDAILPILLSRTVQSTYVDRCWTVAPALAHVAALAGEPINLIEIGCSAGVLLTFDSYGYQVPGRGLAGRANAPLTLTGTVSGNAPFRIARAGARIGIDLQPLDAASPDDRRWLLALCLPELRDAQQRLALALDVAARADLTLLRGDALERLPEALASVAGPVCVFHSVCLLYWPDPARAALDAMLREASGTREIYRLGFELADAFDALHAGREGSVDAPGRPAGATFDVVMTRYAGGDAQSTLLAHATPDFTVLHWRG